MAADGIFFAFLSGTVLYYIIYLHNSARAKCQKLYLHILFTYFKYAFYLHILFTFVISNRPLRFNWSCSSCARKRAISCTASPGTYSGALWGCILWVARCGKQTRAGPFSDGLFFRPKAINYVCKCLKWHAAYHILGIKTPRKIPSHCAPQSFCLLPPLAIIKVSFHKAKRERCLDTAICNWIYGMKHAT